MPLYHVLIDDYILLYPNKCRIFVPNLNDTIFARHKNKYVTIMDNIIINIKADFSDSPGARYRKDGPHSGEEFYDTLLKPKFEEAVRNQVKLVVNLDGVWGYPSSFVSGSFGKLSLEVGKEAVLSTIIFISEESEIRKNRIIDEIEHPTKRDR